MPYVAQLPVQEIEDWNGHPAFRPLDDDFEVWCDYLARSIAVEHAESPDLLGYFLVDIPAWLPYASGRDFGELVGLDPADREKRLYDVASRYYETVAAAIRRYDPDHLILGDRFNGSKGIPEPVLRAMTPHVDLLSVQYFTEPTTEPRTRLHDDLAAWREQCGDKPVIVARWRGTEGTEMGQLDGKVAVITGGGRGQGRSHAIRLAEEGADIVVCDITEQVGSVPFATGRPGDLQETVAAVEKLDRRCVALQADVRSTADMNRLADTAVNEFGRIDFLLANAGILSLSDTTWELTDEQWDDMIDINLTGVFTACRAVVPHIRAGGSGGSTIITSSIAGLKGVAGCTHYTATKHGIVGLMRTLAHELAPEGIRVDTLHPTGVDSPMSNNDYFPRWLDEHKELGDAMRGNLMPVDAMPEADVSAVVAFLCSDAAKWITGVTLPVDAGFLPK